MTWLTCCPTWRWTRWTIWWPTILIILERERVKTSILVVRIYASMFITRSCKHPNIFRNWNNYNDVSINSFWHPDWRSTCFFGQVLKPCASSMWLSIWINTSNNCSNFNFGFVWQVLKLCASLISLSKGINTYNNCSYFIFGFIFASFKTMCIFNLVVKGNLYLQ